MAKVRKIPDDFYLALGRVCHGAAFLERCIDDAITGLESCSSQTVGRNEALKHWTFDAKIRRVEDLVTHLPSSELRSDLEFLLAGLDAARDQRNDCIHGVVGYIDGTDKLNRLRVVRVAKGVVEVREKEVSFFEYQTFANELWIRGNHWIRTIVKHKLLVPLQDGEPGTMEYME